jgi:hypothetical protein
MEMLQARSIRITPIAPRCRKSTGGKVAFGASSRCESDPKRSVIPTAREPDSWRIPKQLQIGPAKREIGASWFSPQRDRSLPEFTRRSNSSRCAHARARGPPGRAHFEPSPPESARYGRDARAAYRGAAQATSAPAKLRMAAPPRDWIVSGDAVIDAILYIGSAALHRRRSLWSTR